MQAEQFDTSRLQCGSNKKSSNDVRDDEKNGIAMIVVEERL